MLKISDSSDPGHSLAVMRGRKRVIERSRVNLWLLKMRINLHVELAMRRRRIIGSFRGCIRLGCEGAGKEFINKHPHSVFDTYLTIPSLGISSAISSRAP